MNPAEIEGKLHDYQFGFRAGYSTVYTIFILQTLFERSRSTKSSLCGCFVDFQEAFDSINHNTLWTKLQNLGMSNKLLNLLYSKAKTYVKINGLTSHEFNCNTGVRARLSTKPNIVQFLYKLFNPFSC